MKKILLIVLAIVIIAIGSFLSYLKFALPSVGDACTPSELAGHFWPKS